MEQKDQGTPQQPTMPPVGGYPPPYGYFPQEDEISLIDLWNVLVKKKKTIFGITTIATIGAVIYALLLPPVYKAETTFLPPSESDIQALNNIQGVQGVQGVSVDSVYTMFKRNLSARAPRKSVFEKMGLLDIFAPERDEKTNVVAIFDGFNKSLSVSVPKPKKGEDAAPITSLAMEGEDPELIAEIINNVGSEAEQATKTEIISNINAKIAARIENLTGDIQLLRDKTKNQRMDEIERLETADRLARESIKDQISALTKNAEHKRQDQITILQEASRIAHALGIKESIGFSLRKIGEAQAQAQAQAQIDISKLGSQQYNRGYEALEAEIASLTNRESDYSFTPEIRELQKRLTLLENNRTVEQLKSRKNDDPFISSLRDKESELAYLKSIHIDPSAVKTARLDQAAYPPEQRIKPKRRLIVVLGFVLGLMLGIFGAFFGNFLENQRKEEEATA